MGRLFRFASQSVKIQSRISRLPNLLQVLNYSVSSFKVNLTKSAYCLSLDRQSITRTFVTDSHKRAAETYRLYLVTDDKYLDKQLIDKVLAAVKGGVSIVQLRLKNASTMEYVEVGNKLKKALREFEEKNGSRKVPLIIDDRLDVALAVDADGLHVGDGDMDPVLVRKFLGPEKILGISGYGDLARVKRIFESCNVAGAGMQEMSIGIDYIAGGGVATSPTKTLIPQGPESYHEFKKGVDALNKDNKAFGGVIVAIGGVTKANAGEAVYSGADGVCCVSNLLELPVEEIESHARGLLEIVEKANEEKPKMKSFCDKTGHGETLLAALETLKERKPLVHCLTNFVSMDIMANVLLASNMSPAMVHAEEEASKFAAVCSKSVANGAVSINIGTISNDWANSMKQVAAVCNHQNIPWVLDPVAVGVPALQYRTDLATELILTYKPTVIRGNSAECVALAKEVLPPTVQKELANFETEQSGADSLTDSMDVNLEYINELAKYTGGVVCMTGSNDYVTCGMTGKRYLVCHNVPQLQLITAAGCSLSSLIAGFLATAIEQDDGKRDYAIATAHATAYFSLAAEEACKKLGPDSGPGSLRVELLNTLQNITPQKVKALTKIQQL